MLGEPGCLFEFYVEDDRYVVPTLRLVVAADDLSASELAMKIMDESAHHTGVEVRSGDRRLVALGTCASPVRRRRGASTGA